MSREDYQRAVADMVRMPAFCMDLAQHGETALAAYDLSRHEQVRLAAMARHRGIAVTCMLYRASRLVGIARRLPVTLQVLGPHLRGIYDAYLEASPDANPDFDLEARAFATFLSETVTSAAPNAEVDGALLRAAMERDLASE
jgi:hypothetical protein